MLPEFGQELARALAGREPRVLAEWPARPAAVLAAMYRNNGDWHLLFTRRTDTLREHSGQVAFPGGAVEQGDESRIDTALREAHEELGMAPDQVQVLGELDELMTVTMYRVTPVVGIVPWPLDLRPNPDEIAAVFGVPLGWLADPANAEQRERKSPIDGRPITVNYYRPWQGHVIWGATALMVQSLLAVLRAHRLPPYTAA